MKVFGFLKLNKTYMDQISVIQVSGFITSPTLTQLHFDVFTLHSCPVRTSRNDPHGYLNLVKVRVVSRGEAWCMYI